MKQKRENLFFIAGILMIVYMLLSFFPICSLLQGMPIRLLFFADHLSFKQIFARWIIPAAVGVLGILMLLKLPNIVHGAGFAVLAVCALLNRAYYGIVPALLLFAFYALLAEALLLKKLPAKKLSVLYAFLPVLAFLIPWFTTENGFALEFIIQQFAFAGSTRALLCVAQLLALAAATKEKEEKLHPIGVIGFGMTAFGLLLQTAIRLISVLFFRRIYVFNGFAFTGMLWIVAFFCVFVGMCLIPFSCLRYVPKKNSGYAGAYGTGASEEDGYIGLGKHVVLLLFTFGIWQFVWIYKTTAYLNRTPNAEKENPSSKLLLCMFVPFYSIYWFYKHGQRIDILSRSRGVERSDMATMCLILSIFVPLVACILMQDRINLLCTVPAGRGSNKAADSDTLENVKRLKELLDSGAITQEEFEAKKKEYLGV